MTKHTAKVSTMVVGFVLTLVAATGAGAQTPVPPPPTLTVSPDAAPQGFSVVATFSGCSKPGVSQLVSRSSGETVSSSEFVPPSSNFFVPPDAPPGDYDFFVRCGSTTVTAHFVVVDPPSATGTLRGGGKWELRASSPTCLVLAIVHGTARSTTGMCVPASGWTSGGAQSGAPFVTEETPVLAWTIGPARYRAIRLRARVPGVTAPEVVTMARPTIATERYAIFVHEFPHGTTHIRRVASNPHA